MAASLLESLGEYITPDLIGRIGSSLGESPGAVTKGVGAVLPALLGGVIEKSREPSAFQQVFSLLTDPANDASVLRQPDGLLGMLGQGGGGLAGLAAKFLPLLFGGRTDGLVSAIASYAGIKSSSAQSLLRLGAPLVLGYLGDRVRKEGLGASALASLLGTQRDSIQRALPSVLAGFLSPAAPRAAEPRPVGRAAEPERGSGRRWLLPAAIGLALLAGLWGVLRGGDERVAERAPATPPVAAPAPVAAPPPTAGVLRRALPNGVQITIPQTGFESQLVGFLTDAGRPLGDTWMNFDRLLFETDSAALQASSREQLANVAEILKAYPSVRVKIGGYTDSTGDAARNLELSRARAATVRAELVALGVAADRLEAEGYGQEHPVASNETEAGRAQNRRIAMRVTAR
jgi:outer membrane protein OmpA-like peptidoglycan-associated protein